MKTVQMYLLFILLFAVGTYPQDILVTDIKTTTGIFISSEKPDDLTNANPNEGIKDEENLLITTSEEPLDTNSNITTEAGYNFGFTPTSENVRELSVMNVASQSTALNPTESENVLTTEHVPCEYRCIPDTSKQEDINSDTRNEQKVENGNDLINQADNLVPIEDSTTKLDEVEGNSTHVDGTATSGSPEAVQSVSEQDREPQSPANSVAPELNERTTSPSISQPATPDSSVTSQVDLKSIQAVVTGESKTTIAPEVPLSNVSQMSNDTTESGLGDSSVKQDEVSANGSPVQGDDSVPIEVNDAEGSSQVPETVTESLAINAADRERETTLGNSKEPELNEPAIGSTTPDPAPEGADSSATSKVDQEDLKTTQGGGPKSPSSVVPVATETTESLETTQTTEAAQSPVEPETEATSKLNHTPDAISESEVNPSPGASATSPTDPEIPLNTCTEAGNFSIPTNCRTYITCSGNKTDLLRQKTECPERSAFSPVLRRCTRDISPCGDDEPQCLTAGSIPNPNSTASYFWCVPSLLSGFHKYHIQCEPNEVFTALIGRCFPESLQSFKPPLNGLPSDRDIVKADWKQLKKAIKIKAKEEKIRRKMEAKVKAHAEKLAAKEQEEVDD